MKGILLFLLVPLVYGDLKAMNRFTPEQHARFLAGGALKADENEAWVTANKSYIDQKNMVA